MDESDDKIDDIVIDKNAIMKTCISCGSTAVEYINIPCKCCSYCKKCAMKLATGSICKLCRKYSNMKSIHAGGH